MEEWPSGTEARSGGINFPDPIIVGREAGLRQRGSKNECGQVERTARRAAVAKIENVMGSSMV